MGFDIYDGWVTSYGSCRCPNGVHGFKYNPNGYNSIRGGWCFINNYRYTTAFSSQRGGPGTFGAVNGNRFLPRVHNIARPRIAGISRNKVAISMLRIFQQDKDYGDGDLSPNHSIR